LTQIGSDAMFQKRKDGISIFSNIDFDRYRKRGFKIATINNIKIMGLNDLIEVYEDNKGDLDEIKQIVRVVGYVASVPTFTQQPAVVNGASELLVEIFGEAGKHARSAVGMAALPLNASVEIELTVEV
jgi:hypothetical protein